ncbi:hypothetical protein NW063_00415 [Mycoplasmopsis cynos]|uniref:hypothetical protein n=1 Tax=Mycoplasmopsis cynos TaxID=171284 RepID=UPI0021FBCACF|nr:hypothetical protein [Mycoplasmopsis cynos]UWV86235.1 hypothetical protein NW063_00415 [Mycoplasmopsis cynos]WAM05325.1 hypothetical protein OM999_02900 [Mycoplasmopsis cynos]
MGTKVTAKCIKCNRVFDYLFGNIQEYDLFNTFLSIFEQKQKNLFIKDIFFEVFKTMLKSDPKLDDLTDEYIDKLLEENYYRVQNFFFSEEITLLQKNIIVGREIRVHTAYNTDLEPEQREMIYLPLLKIKLLDGTEYNRRYTLNAKFVDFTQDQTFLSCCVCDEISCSIIREENFE